MEFKKFKVMNYRNIIDSGWIDINKITCFVGQNEAGKSNLFEALNCLNSNIAGEKYNVHEDWPVDKWGDRSTATENLVCIASFVLTETEITDLARAALVQPAAGTDGDTQPAAQLPRDVEILISRYYDSDTSFKVSGFPEGSLDTLKAIVWAKEHTPKFVYIRDYEMSGAQVELDALKQRLDSVGLQNAHRLSSDDQTVLIILDLANVDLDDFLRKGQTSDGRTVRSFDKRSASAYLTNQFSHLWQQKDVRFDIEIDGPTLNIFVEDAAIGMPVRLHRRSTGFRWYVSFAWKFTHATKGAYKNCILLLEEPGIHLHFSGQRDLLKVFERLAQDNTILYTTHLPSMVDLANPERVRIVESRNNHLAITKGIVSGQPGPMAIIEQCLGLTGDQQGILSNRQVLIVEGGDDAVILHKLSGLLNKSGEEALSDRIYIWPARGAPKTPMYAGFAIGQGWDAGVLLDSDRAGIDAKEKIKELYLPELADEKNKRFRIFLLGSTVGAEKTDFAIEDMFPDEFYLDCVNAAYGLAIRTDDLPNDGSDMITKRVEHVLKNRYSRSGLDKRQVLTELYRRFDNFDSVSDLPAGCSDRARRLFKAVNAAFRDG